jgi:hypothetical protein
VHETFHEELAFFMAHAKKQKMSLKELFYGNWHRTLVVPLSFIFSQPFVNWYNALIQEFFCFTPPQLVLAL